MKREPLRVGQIGVGYWGPNLLRNLSANPACRVVMAADLSQERRDYVNKNFPAVKTCADPQEIIKDPEVEAVVIATPAGTHFELAMAALQAGKHILVEKPMARTPQEVEAIGACARQQRLVAMAGHTFVYNAAVHCLKKLIESGELGQVRYIYSRRLNLGRVRSDVDAMWNFAPHDVSIVQFLLGDPKPLSVSAHAMDYVQRGISDVVFLNIVYPNRIMVNIHVSWLDPTKERTMVVVGSDKMAVYDDTAENKVSIYDKGVDRMAVLGQNMDFDRPTPYTFSHRCGEVSVPALEFAEPLQVEVAHFVECIRDGRECLTGPEHALRVVKILWDAQPH